MTENKGGKIRAFSAMLRLGRNLSEVDNASSGGFSTNIDISSGCVGDFAISYRAEKFEEHPDTHFIFHNLRFSHWQKILKFATESAGKIPFFTYLGWDIALTPEGLVAVEINHVPALDIMELTTGGLRKAFGIEDPDFTGKT